MKMTDTPKRLKDLKMVISPVTGLPVVSRRPGQRKVTTAQVRKIADSLP